MPPLVRRARPLAALAVGAVLTAACGIRSPLTIDAGPNAEPEAPITGTPRGDTRTGTTPSAGEPDAPRSHPRDATRPGQPDPDQPPREPEPPRDTRPATPATSPTSPRLTPDGEPAARNDVLEPGDRGARVTTLQRRLTDLGYWLGEIDGVYGHLTRQAVLAFQGWQELARDGRVGPATRAALADARRPAPRRDGDLVEIHRDRGLLLVVRDGRTRWALHTSTGTGERYRHPNGHLAVADTPAGTWRVGWQVDGWRRSSLGRLWRPKYFHEDGLAIHGYAEVPAQPASHGCARVSIEAMNLLWDRDLLPRGSTVVVL